MSNPGPVTSSWIERASKVMTSRQSNVRALPEPSIFLDHGLGQRLWDVDGKEYIDFAIAMGPGIWGHGNREYLDSIHSQLEKLVYVQSGACQSTLEVELSEKIVEHVPCAERVRFHLSGSESVQMAIRLARAHTGRPYFVRFAGHYHGWLDNVFGGTVNPDHDLPPHAIVNEKDVFFTEGRSPRSYEESFMIPWNDIAAFEKLVRNHGHEICLVMMEVFNSNGGGCNPKPGYLEAVRDICTKNGIVLYFDEIITGFRAALGGAQSLVRVTPDLATFGKAIAGGLPLAAIAGKAEIFEHFRTNKVVGAGTFNSFPVGMAAALTSIRMLERGNGAVYAERDRIQTRFMDEFVALGLKHGHMILLQSMPGGFCMHFTDEKALWNHADMAKVNGPKAMRLRTLLRERGVVPGLGNRYFISFAFTDKDADDTLTIIDQALGELK